MTTFRTLLSGGELFGVGARQAGYTHIDGYEIDGKIAAVARSNGFDVRQADICQVDYASLPDADHLHASPVCTRASSANVGAEESDLDLAMADAICCAIAAHRGRTISIENVWAYREFESFKRICAALTAAGFIYDVAHLNAADYGVPQTRKRLIARGVRGAGRVPGLRPTHGKRGGILLDRWNGWYDAIKDFIHELPETQPAPWQLVRMPKELRESMLIGTDGWENGVVSRSPDAPAFTMTATDNQQQIRAYLIPDQNTGNGRGDWVREKNQPSMTLGATASARAWLMEDQRAGSSDGIQVRMDHEPALTVRSLGVSGGAAPRAYLISDKNARSEERGGMSCREGSDPVWTVDTAMKGSARAYTDGRWVRMDIRALGRFQSVLDDYRGLTPQINGNGVPPLLARRIMESLRGVYANA